MKPFRFVFHGKGIVRGCFLRSDVFPLIRFSKWDGDLLLMIMTEEMSGVELTWEAGWKCNDFSCTWHQFHSIALTLTHINDDFPA